MAHNVSGKKLIKLQDQTQNSSGTQAVKKKQVPSRDQNQAVSNIPAKN